MEQSTVYQQGLTSLEASKRLASDGPNALPTKKPRNFLLIMLDTAKEPMFLLLIVASSIYLFIGELKEGLSLFVFVNLIIFIKLYQEGKTEKALSALRELSSPQSHVIRDNNIIQINSLEIVKGDVLLIKEGDRIPADGYLIEVNNLRVDESLLTGESFPINKYVTSEKNLNLVYAGTLVIQGQGVVKVDATGIHTQMGKIGVELESITTEKSPLLKQIELLVKIIAIFSLLFCASLIVIDGLLHQDWLQATLLGIALIMSIIPEEFPVVLTIFPALGAWRLAKKNVLTRHILAIETLGTTTALCVDKTGTITENKMIVSCLWADKKFFFVEDLQRGLSAFEAELIEYAILASQKHAFDPMEKAFHQLGQSHLKERIISHKNWQLTNEIPLSAQVPAMTHFWKISDNEKYLVATKGSPETIMKLCHLNDKSIQEISAALSIMAQKGLRILAVAKGHCDQTNIPQTHDDLTLNFIGLIGLSDPLRANIPESVKECHEAGIKVVMITGDYPLTAITIGKQAGLSVSSLLTGEDLNLLSESELKEKMLHTEICARVSPHQKYQIVKALKESNHIVAMTGDGVNDAPALKSAHVSIAMGQRGTEVARETSSLILLDDNFNSIVNAIRSGRLIFANMQKSMAFILAVHIPIAGLAFFPIISNLPPIFYPLHIALIELIIDPTCSIAFENEPPEKDLMKHPPRGLNEYILNKKIVISSVLQGFGVLVIVYLAYFFSLDIMNADESRTLAFTSLCLANLLLIFANRSKTQSILKSFMVPNKILFFIILTTLMILFSLITIPFFASILHFAPPTQEHLLICLGSVVLFIMWFEVIKMSIKT
ncbi:MAG: cation-translocating P-type ATPase [Proteobacteria bacterium]|nr:cation-translocating P-type ATPase [Pseudomonadota bacterium]